MELAIAITVLLMAVFVSAAFAQDGPSVTFVAVVSIAAIAILALVFDMSLLAQLLLLVATVVTFSVALAILS